MINIKEQIRSDYVVVDLETTGLSPDNDAIIEIAAVKVISGEVIGSYSTLVDPRRHISAAITAITGINDDMIKGAPYIDEAMKGFLEFAGDMPLLGHNLIRFDMRFLKKQADMNNPCVDTLLLSEHIKTGSCGHSLSALCSRFGIVNDNAHRALSDCMATHKVYLALKETYEEKGAFFTMAVSCAKKEYQKNIAEFCEIGTVLTYEHDKNMLFAGELPVGTISEGKRRELEANDGLVSKIAVSKIEEGAGKKLLLGAEVSLFSDMR